MKNCKTFYAAKTTSHLKEIIQPLPNLLPFDKILLPLWNKSYSDIQKYTDISFGSASRMHFLSIKK